MTASLILGVVSLQSTFEVPVVPVRKFFDFILMESERSTEALVRELARKFSPPVASFVSCSQIWLEVADSDSGLHLS